MKNNKSIKVTIGFSTGVGEDANRERRHNVSKTLLIFSDPNELQVKAHAKRIADGMLATAQLQHGYITNYEDFRYIVSEIIYQDGGTLVG
jgi:hypothetical protein